VVVVMNWWQVAEVQRRRMGRSALLWRIRPERVLSTLIRGRVQLVGLMKFLIWMNLSSREIFQ